MKTYTGNPSLMRDMNRANVLDIIRLVGPITQTQISKILSLQPSTILRIVNDLVHEELVAESGKVEAGAKGGRRASLLELNAKGAFAIGVDLGSDDIIAVLMDLSGQIVSEASMPFPEKSEPEPILQTVKAAIQGLLDSGLAPIDRVMGIGVSIPGKVDSVAGVSVYAIHFQDWSNVPVSQVLEEAFQLPVYIEHDIRSMAFGEMWFGTECQNMICLGFRRGIGLGIVMNGELYQGANQFAGDVGHVVVDPDGPLCSCGRHGCLEAMASERAVIAKYRQRLQHGQGPVTIAHLYEEVKHGTPEVIELVQETASHMGKILADLVRIFDPERIIIGGNCMATSPEFLAWIRSSFESHQPNYADPETTVETTIFGENSMAIGAAAIILSKLFEPSRTGGN